MQNLTPLGWFVLGVFATLALWLLVLVASCLWWVGIDSPQAEFWGWCGGSMTEGVSF